MGKGAGKGRGDDSSSSSDEVDGKIKVLYMIILLLLGLLATFVTAVIVLVWAKEQSGKTTDIGQIFPPTAGTNTLGQPALAEFDDPQIISVKHPNFPDSVVIYCTSGIGLPNAEVPCESSTILYNDASRFKMDKNGAYACIFCKDQELCSNILEQNYAINSKPPTIKPLEDTPGSQLATLTDKFVLSFATKYDWKKQASPETIVFYTNASTTKGGTTADCDKISNADFEQCANFPKVPCWPPKVIAARASKVFQYDETNPPTMDSSVCIGALTKVRNMNVGTKVPSQSYAEMRYLISSVAEVRVEPCKQDGADYTSQTPEITMWTSTPKAKIKYTIDYNSACINADAQGIGSHPGNALSKCDRVLRGSTGKTLAYIENNAAPGPGTAWPKLSPVSMVHPKTTHDKMGNKLPANCAADVCGQLYSQPISIPYTARVLAVGQHDASHIKDGILSVCDYEVVVANPSCTTEAGSAWMGVSTPMGSPLHPKTNTDSAVVRFLSPTDKSTVWFQYCDETYSACGKTWRYNPAFPPIIYQSVQIRAWATKSRLTKSKEVTCKYVVKPSAPVFTPPSSYLDLGKPGGTWVPKGVLKKGTNAGGPAANVIPGVPDLDSFFTLNTKIQLSMWSWAQCDDTILTQPAGPDGRGCRQATDYKIFFRWGAECCSLAPKDVSGGCAWHHYTATHEAAGGLVLTGSKQLCTKAVNVGRKDGSAFTTSGPDSIVRTSNFFLYAEAPDYSQSNYKKFINEMQFCLKTSTPGASISYRTDPSTLASNFKGPVPSKLATFDKTYPYITTLTSGLGPLPASGCVVLEKSTLVSAVTHKDIQATPPTCKEILVADKAKCAAVKGTYPYWGDLADNKKCASLVNGYFAPTCIVKNSFKYIQADIKACTAITGKPLYADGSACISVVKGAAAARCDATTGKASDTAACSAVLPKDLTDKTICDAVRTGIVLPAAAKCVEKVAANKTVCAQVSALTTSTACDAVKSAAVPAKCEALKPANSATCGAITPLATNAACILPVEGKVDFKSATCKAVDPSIAADVTKCGNVTPDPVNPGLCTSHKKGVVLPVPAKCFETPKVAKCTAVLVADATKCAVTPLTDSTACLAVKNATTNKPLCRYTGVSVQTDKNACKFVTNLKDSKDCLAVLDSTGMDKTTSMCTYVPEIVANPGTSICKYTAQVNPVAGTSICKYSAYVPPKPLCTYSAKVNAYSGNKVCKYVPLVPGIKLCDYSAEIPGTPACKYTKPAALRTGNHLAPSHRNHDVEFAGTLSPADVAMATKAWYYVEVDQPVMSPDQRDRSLWGNGVVDHDKDGNKNGELYNSQELTITTSSNLPVSNKLQSAVTISYAIEKYHCTDPDGSGPLTIADSMLGCSLADRAKIDIKMKGFGQCNMYDPSHSCEGTAVVKAKDGTPAAATPACAAIQDVYETVPATCSAASATASVAEKAVCAAVTGSALADGTACGKIMTGVVAPNVAQCVETAVVSVATDRKACFAVTALVDGSMCNNVKTAADNTKSACTYKAAVPANPGTPLCTYAATYKQMKFSKSCNSYIGVKYPKVAQYVMTCSSLSESQAGTLAPYSGCEFQTYNSANKPVVDLSSYVFTYASKPGLERSTTAMMEFEITVNGVNIAPCGAPTAKYPDGKVKPYYVGPTPITLTNPVGRSWRKAIDGRADSKLWSTAAKQQLGADPKVTIHYYWSQEQYESGALAGKPLSQPGTAATSSANPAKKLCKDASYPGTCTVANTYDWLAPGPGGPTRYEYAYRGRLIAGEIDTRLANPPSGDRTTNGGLKHRPRLTTDLAGKTFTTGTAYTVTEIGTLYAYASKPGLTPSPVSSCEYEVQVTPPDWFQSGEICNEVSSSKLKIPVCLSPALFGSGFVFLWSEKNAEIHYELRDNAVAVPGPDGRAVRRSSKIFDKWIQLVATGSTFFYSLKSFAIKKGMWDSDEVNQPFVVVTEVSRGAVPSTDLAVGISSTVCNKCTLQNILYGKPGQFWGAETAGPKTSVSIRMDFPGNWEEAFNECGEADRKGGQGLQTATAANTIYLITTVYLAYPFIPDPARGYARSASACSDFQVEVRQSVRDASCGGTSPNVGQSADCDKKIKGVRQSWEIGGEKFDATGKQLECAPKSNLPKAQSPGCWRDTHAADSPKRFRSSDTYTPPQPIRGTALRYTCKKMPFYLESWVAYGIAGTSLDTTTTGGVHKCTPANGVADSGWLDCKGKCVSKTFLGDGTCDDGKNAATNMADFNCVKFLYDKMDCFALDAGATDLTVVFNELYQGYDGPGCTPGPSNPGC